MWTTLLGLSDVESHFDVREMWTVRDVDTLEDAVVAIVAVRKTAEVRASSTVFSVERYVFF